MEWRSQAARLAGLCDSSVVMRHCQAAGLCDGCGRDVDAIGVGPVPDQGVVRARFCDRRDGRRRRRSILRVSCRVQAKPPWVANEIIRFKALATLISPFWIAFWKEGSLSFIRI